MADLEIFVKGVGVEQFKSDMANVTASGEAAAAKVGAAGEAGAARFASGFSANAVRARESATTFAAMFEQQFQADMARISEGVARGFLSPAQARAAGVEAAQAYNQGLLSQLDQLGAGGLNVGNSATYRELAGSFKTIDEASIGAGAGLGRVRQGLISLLAQATGTIPVLDRVGGSLATMAVGGTITLGVVAGIALIVGAYELMTEDSRKLKEEQDKLTDSLGKWYDKQQQGATGEFEAQIGAEIQALKDMRAALDNTLQGKTFSDIPEFLKDVTKAFVLGSFNPSTAIHEFETLWNQYVEGQKKAIAKGADEVKAAGRAAYQDLVKSSQTFYTTEATGLSGLVGAGTATPEQIARSTQLLGVYQHSLAELQQAYGGLKDAKDKAFNLEQQVAAADNIKKIADAQREALLAPLKAMQDEQTANAAFIPKLVDDLNKQGDAMRALAVSSGKEYQASLDAARQVGVEGIAREYLTNTLRAEGEVRDALRTLTGVELTARLDSIAATQRQTHENISHAAALQDEADRLKVMSDLQKDANAIAEENIKKTRVQTDEYAKLGRQISGDLLKAVEQFTRGGTVSFASFFRAAENFSAHMLEQIGSDLDAMARKEAEAIKNHEDAQAKKYATDIAQYEQYQKVAQGLGAALAGASIGYAVGQQTNSGFNAAGAGAVAGAVAGGEIAGPWGAVIGGLTGAVGGLLGAAQAHRDAAKALEDAGKALSTSIQSYATNNALQAAMLDNENKRDALQLQAQQLLDARLAQAAKDGSKSEVNSAFGQYQAAIEAITKAYTDNVARLVASQIEEQKQLQYTLDAREAYAKGLTAEGDAITRRAAEDKELFDDQVAGYTEAQLAQVKYIQGLEDEAAAKAKATAAQRQAEDYQVRGLVASGQTSAAAQQRFALDQAREMEDAIKAGTDPVTLAILANTQSLEAVAFAAKQLQAALEQNVSDIQRDLKLGLTTSDAARQAEAQQFGFGGLTNEQIKALYTPFTGTALTPEQEQLNNNIAQFFQDFPDLVASIASGTGGGGGTVAGAGERNAVSNAAQALTEVTGNRMADYDAAMLIVQRQILDVIRAGFYGGGSSIAPYTSNLTATATPFVNLAPSRSIAPSSPTSSSSSAAAPQIAFNTSVIVESREGETDDLFVRRIATEVSKEMAAEFAGLLARAGDPIRPGR
jgi:hypothetical protein